MSQIASKAAQGPGAKFPVGVARERIRDLRKRGLSPREIARLLDVSTQAVNYHIKRLKSESTEAVS